MPYASPDDFAKKAALLQYIGDVVKGPPGWFGPQKMLEGGPVYRGGANPFAGATNEPSAGDRAQTSMPVQPSDILKAHDQLMQTLQRPTWQQQYGSPQPGQPSIDTPSMRAAMEAGNARDAEIEKFGAGMGLPQGTAQRVFNQMVLHAENTGAPNPSINQVKYFLTLLRQKGEL